MKILIAILSLAVSFVAHAETKKLHVNEQIQCGSEKPFGIDKDLKISFDGDVGSVLDVQQDGEHKIENLISLSSIGQDGLVVSVILEASVGETNLINGVMTFAVKDLNAFEPMAAKVQTTVDGGGGCFATTTISPVK